MVSKWLLDRVDVPPFSHKEYHYPVYTIIIEPHSHNCQTFALLIYAMFITDNKYEVFHVPCCGEMMQPDISYTKPTKSVQGLINTFHWLRLSSFIVQMGMYIIIFSRLGVEFSLWTLPVFLFLWTTVYHAAIGKFQTIHIDYFVSGIKIMECAIFFPPKTVSLIFGKRHKNSCDSKIGIYAFFHSHITHQSLFIQEIIDFP